jgi:hypothetical protein
MIPLRAGFLPESGEKRLESGIVVHGNLIGNVVWKERKQLPFSTLYASMATLRNVHAVKIDKAGISIDQE